MFFFMYFAGKLNKAGNSKAFDKTALKIIFSHTKGKEHCPGTMQLSTIYEECSIIAQIAQMSGLRVCNTELASDKLCSCSVTYYSQKNGEFTNSCVPTHYHQASQYPFTIRFLINIISGSRITEHISSQRRYHAAGTTHFCISFHFDTQLQG